MYAIRSYYAEKCEWQQACNSGNGGKEYGRKPGLRRFQHRLANRQPPPAKLIGVVDQNDTAVNYNAHQAG